MFDNDLMIHIDEVRQHLETHPEPDEVKEIREKILSEFGDIEFVEESHQYFLPQDGVEKKELQSVSAFVEQFVPFVDWDEKAYQYAVKHDLTPEYVKRLWEENNLIATNNGTSTHLYGENLMYFCLDRLDMISPVLKPQLEKGYLVPYSAKQMAIMQFYKDMLSSGEIYPVLAETRVYMVGNEKYPIVRDGYAGTFDMLFAFKGKNGKWKLIIGDFKTNKSLTKEFARNHDIFMMKPFGDMIDEALSHYVVQLSAYQLALSQLGYEIADRRIIWAKEDGTYEKIRVPDVSDVIVKFLMAKA